MQVLQTTTFKRSVKKLHANQKKILDRVIQEVIKDPTIGAVKSGDLSGILVHKFQMFKQLTLLAYTYHEQTITLTLLALGSHENFYQNSPKKMGRVLHH